MNTAKLAPAIAAGLGSLVATQVLRRRNRMDFQDRTVVVTGGSRGLGLVLAREFAAAGARVAVCGRYEDELDDAFEDLRRRGARALAATCDITDQSDVRAFFSAVRER